MSSLTPETLNLFLFALQPLPQHHLEEWGPQVHYRLCFKRTCFAPLSSSCISVLPNTPFSLLLEEVMATFVWSVLSLSWLLLSCLLLFISSMNSGAAKLAEALGPSSLVSSPGHKPATDPSVGGTSPLGQAEMGSSALFWIVLEYSQWSVKSVENVDYHPTQKDLQSFPHPSPPLV